jgi:hypothetical protein
MQGQFDLLLFLSSIWGEVVACSVLVCYEAVKVGTVVVLVWPPNQWCMRVRLALRADWCWVSLCFRCVELDLDLGLDTARTGSIRMADLLA